MTAAFAAPVIFYTGVSEGLMLVKLTTLSVLAVVASALLVAKWMETGSLPPQGRSATAVLLFAVVMALATATSVAPTVSLIGLYQRFGGLLPQLVYLTLAGAVVASYWSRPAALWEIIRATAAAATVLSAYILVQAGGLDWIPWRLNGAPPEYPGGTMGNSNFAGGFLAIALPLSVAAMLAARGRTRALLGAACGSQLLALWYTGNRGGMLAVVVTTLGVCAVARRSLPAWSKVAAAVVALALVASATLLVWHPGLDRAPGPLASVRTSTLFSRVSYWRSAVAQFAERPVFGSGLDTFYRQYPRHELAEEARRQPLTIVDKPHSIFLERLADGGLVGLTSYLGVVGLTLVYGVRALRREDSGHRPLLLALLASLFAYLAQGFFSIDVAPLAFMGWLLLAAIVAVADPTYIRGRSEREPATAARPITFGLRLAQSVVALASIAALGVVTRPLIADVAARQGAIGTAMALQPLEPTYVIIAADLARSRAVAQTDPSLQRSEFASAQTLYRRADRLQPGNINYTTALASLNSIWAQSLDPARFAVAERWWRKALDDNPQNIALREQYAGVREAMRDSLRRREQDGAGPSPEAFLGIAKAYVALGDLDSARAAARRGIHVSAQDRALRELLDSLG